MGNFPTALLGRRMYVKTLSIDIETYSSADLTKCGVYKYTEADDFEILLFGYSVDRGDVQVVDLAKGEKVPNDILQALSDEDVTKWAFNANFERVCLSAYLRKHYPQYFHSYSISDDTVGNYLNPRSWKCSMVWSAYMGLPLSLKGVGAVLKLDEQKMDEGKALIKYFSMLCTPTKANGERIRNLPHHAPDKWETFKFYNRRDVEVEMAIQERLKNFPVPDFLWEEYWLDQEINDRGIALDGELVENAVILDKATRELLLAKMYDITHLDNPNSVVQMREWLVDKGLEVDSLGKKDVQELLKTVPPELAEVLLLRQQVSKSSVKKYQAMENAMCKDGRARGMFQFYGANRSGRWAGRLIQLQNLAKNHMPDLAQVRALLHSGNFGAITLLYDNIPDTLSQLIRTAFIPKKGYKFIVADFSAIEARVIAWIAGEQWRLDVFQRGGDIYCASAAQMFGVPVEKNGVNGHLRQKGKQAELACGYGGSVGALKAMGALEMGLHEEELQPLVDSWRAANPNIVRLWWAVDSCVKETIEKRVPTSTNGIGFTYQSGMLFITLPSGRSLAYVKPQIGENRFGGKSVTYEGIGAAKKWERIETFGGKLVENIVQAIARDILCYALQTLSHCFIVAHVHDEIIIEASKDVSFETICEQMGRTPPWAEGLSLRADGYECEFYRKE